MEFEIGDKIEFEFSNSQHGPRWLFNDDTGPTGIRCHGEVVSIDDEIIEVAYTIDEWVGTGYCRFPNFNHPDYFDEQWVLPGYLKLIQSDLNANKKCECGSEKIYGPAATGHSSWCPKYRG